MLVSISLGNVLDHIFLPLEHEEERSDVGVNQFFCCGQVSSRVESATANMSCIIL